MDSFFEEWKLRRTIVKLYVNDVYTECYWIGTSTYVTENSENSRLMNIYPRVGFLGESSGTF